MESLFSGELGIFLVNLAFPSALLAAAAFLFGLKDGPQARGWRLIGRVAFAVHAVAVLGTIGNLFGMILTQQYQYHYVFSHSSNELPLRFAVACLWEGQEGSFLLWMSWHALLGLILLATLRKWRPGVLAVIASVQAILTSMVLGAWLPQGLAQALFALALLAPAAYLAQKYLVRERQAATPQERLTALWAALAAALALVVVFRGLGGFFPGRLVEEPVLAALALGLFGMLAYATWQYRIGLAEFPALAGAVAVFALAWTATLVPMEGWKVGSSPFLLLKEVRGNDPIYQLNPDFVPANGNGLNSLLQNYWMVIHPPTLFLGFASTVVPFAFVIAALLRREYGQWIKPAASWTIFSVMILGVGIIMGGYWAYETLNFGGYWNWDPVENASLVPWLTGVGGLHAMLAYRKSKTNLPLTFVLVISTFILVLYSTFLTRSGILGEASVHSFTDLGLSGQLLMLLLFYLVVIVLLLARHWADLPKDRKEVAAWSREFFLFLAALTLTFCAIEISLFTSLPVFNKIFGTNLAPPAELQFFYYKWNVWFGVAIAALSGVGQYFYWTKVEKTEISKALFLPAALAVGATVAVFAYMLLADWSASEPRWQFVYHELYNENMQAAQDAAWYKMVGAVLWNGLQMLLDDFLLVCGVFTIFANGLIILRLVKRSRKNLKHIGGSLAHIGFGLMLLGMLFSAGYEDTVSVNLSPNEMSEVFSDDDKKVNVQLFRNTPKDMKGYRVTYKGIKQAEGPIDNMKVLYADAQNFKLGFEDRYGDRYALDLRTGLYRKGGGELPVNHAASSTEEWKKLIDMDKARFHIEEQLDIFNPDMMNDRVVYELEFMTFDSSRKFMVHPEFEVSEGMGNIPHPDRQIDWNKDLYVHVTSIPAERTSKWETVLDQRVVLPGDTFSVEGLHVKVREVKQVPDAQQRSGADFVAKMYMDVTHAGKTYTAEPMMALYKGDKRPQLVEDYIPELKLRTAFVVSTQNLEGGGTKQAPQMYVQFLRKEEPLDFITINAIAKPMINLLWLGTFVMTAGFLVAIFRRANEYRRERRRKSAA